MRKKDHRNLLEQTFDSISGLLNLCYWATAIFVISTTVGVWIWKLTS